MRRFTRLTAVAAAAALSFAVSSAANATALNFGSGDVTSGSFGDSHIGRGNFSDTLAFDLATDGLFSASLTSAAARLGRAGDINFSSVVLTGPDGPFNFSIRNNDSFDGLTDTAVFTGLLNAGSYLLTISGYSYGNSQFGGNTTVQTADVPEPASWLMMVAGFGAIGAATRRRKVRDTTYA